MTQTSLSPPNLTSSFPVLAGYGVSKQYAGTTVLDGVNVTLSAGESVAVMGPSGSGKSTLLHALAGVIKPDGGEVVLGGTSIGSFSEARRSALRRTRFGFVFQNGQLLPELPADENVALPLMLNKMPRRQALLKARAWFGPLGLSGCERRRPGELSGGQAQRVAIARAVVTRPSVVFADEPTGALDQATGHVVLDILISATRELDTALLVVTHDPGVASCCQRVLQMRDGAIVTSEREQSDAPVGARS